jgi:hypothetical protein
MIGVGLHPARTSAAQRCKVGTILDIILHMGAHRTATTTLQNLIHRNRAELAMAGIAAWTPERTRNGLFAGLIHAPETLTDQVERRGARSCGVIAVELARLAQSGHRQLIVSEENMLGAARNNMRQGRLYPQLAERLRRLAPAFGSRCRRIGLSIRAYDSYWASAFAFGVAEGHRMPGPDMLDRLVTQPRRWRDVICDVAAAFPAAELVVWPFERLAGQPDRQLALLTGGLSQYMTLQGARDWRNPSPRLGQLREILNDRGEPGATAALPGGNGRWMPFDAEQQAALRSQYLADLTWLRRGADGLARLAGADDARPPLANRHSEFQINQQDQENQTETDVIGGKIGATIPVAPPQAKGQNYGTQRYMV